MKKILLADESITIQKVIQISLKDKYDLQVCSNLDEIYKKLDSDKPNLLIMDFRISPDISGYDLVYKLKNNYPDLKIMLLFHSYDEVDEASFSRSQANLWLKKPFESLKLIEHCEKILEKDAYLSVIEEEKIQESEQTIPSIPHKIEGEEEDWGFPVPEVIETGTREFNLEESKEFSLDEDNQEEEELSEENTVFFDTLDMDRELAEEETTILQRPSAEVDNLDLLVADQVEQQADLLVRKYIDENLDSLIEKHVKDYCEKNFAVLAWKIIPTIAESFFEKELKTLTSEVLAEEKLD